MLHHLLPYLAKPFVFGQKRNVAVHLAVDFNIVYHLKAVGLQSTIKVIELYLGYAAGRSVEKLRRNGLGQRIVTLLLPAAYQIIAVFHDHSTQFRNFLRAVLKVGVHGDDYLA